MVLGACFKKSFLAPPPWRWPGCWRLGAPSTRAGRSRGRRYPIGPSGAGGRVQAVRRHCHRRQSARRSEAGRFVASGEPRNCSARFLRADPAAEPRGVSARSAGPASRGRALPPTHEGAEIGEAPVAAPRPPEFGPLSAPARHPVRPNVATAPPAAPVDDRSIFQKLFGTATVRADGRLRSARKRRRDQDGFERFHGFERIATTESRGAGRGPLFSFPSPFGGSAPASGYAQIYRRL